MLYSHPMILAALESAYRAATLPTVPPVQLSLRLWIESHGTRRPLDEEERVVCEIEEKETA